MLSMFAIDERLRETAKEHKKKGNWVVYGAVLVLWGIAELVNHWFYSSILEFIREWRVPMAIKHAVIWCIENPVTWALVLLVCTLTFIVIHAYRRSVRKQKLPNVAHVELALEIGNVINHRTGTEGNPYRYGDLFVQASVQLLHPSVIDVTYSAQIVFRGGVLDLEQLNDVGSWEVMERDYFKHPGLRPRSTYVTNITPLDSSLSNLRKSEGWLHFRIEGLTEHQIDERTLRLYAAIDGRSWHVDEELAGHTVVRSALVVMRKLVPRPQ
jgi:hypothetical protein